MSDRTVSASCLSWRLSQRRRRTCPQRSCTNVISSAGSPQVSGCLQANRRPRLGRRPRPWYVPGGPYNTRSRRNRASKAHGSCRSGPKPKKGEWAPSLAARLADPATTWSCQSIDWYGGRQRLIEYTTGTDLWYTPGYDPLPIRWVLVRDPLGEFEATAFFTTNQAAPPLQILNWFIMRWGLEVTFEEARAHLGLETQRQWADLAIQRTTPALLGLSSLITLLAHQLSDGDPPVQSAAWYAKRQATFSDTIALVRDHLWTTLKFVNSPAESRFRLIPDAMLPGLVETICYAR